MDSQVTLVAQRTAGPSTVLTWDKNSFLSASISRVGSGEILYTMEVAANNSSKVLRRTSYYAPVAVITRLGGMLRPQVCLNGQAPIKLSSWLKPLKTDSGPRKEQ
jgi:hypothetical protein